MLALLTAGCALGPVQVTHVEGEVPKMRVEVTEEIKVKVKYDKVALVYKREF
jgi:hypothetical protein